MGKHTVISAGIVAELQLRAATATFKAHKALARRRTLQSMGARKAATEQAEMLRSEAAEWSALARYARENA